MLFVEGIIFPPNDTFPVDIFDTTTLPLPVGFMYTLVLFGLKRLILLLANWKFPILALAEIIPLVEIMVVPSTFIIPY